MKCKNCGKQFFKRNGMQKHCSAHCRMMYQRRSKYEKKCVICGNGFKSKSISKQSCSEMCFHELMSGKVNARFDQNVVKENKKKRAKRHWDNTRKNISTKYVKQILYAATGIKMSEIINVNLIELKKDQLRLKREIKKSKEEMANVAY